MREEFQVIERMKKIKGENFLQKGQRVWLVNGVVSCKVRRHRLPLGVVHKDSLWPDMFVDVDIWNKKDHGKWLKSNSRRNHERRIQGA